MRLRTQLVLVTVLISCALTGICLFVVRQSVRAEFRLQSAEAARASVGAFERINREHETDLLRTAALLSELPTLKAVMTTEHPATVQDASRPFWELSATDLFILAGPGRERVLAVHASGTAPPRESIERFLRQSGHDQLRSWWQSGSELFRVIERPILAGEGPEQHVLGTLIIGRRISNEVARQIGHFAGSDIALSSSASVVASTLNARGKDQVEEIVAQPDSSTRSKEVEIDDQPYEMFAIDLDTDSAAPLRCYILFPLRSTYIFLTHLNRTLLVVGILAAGLGAFLMMIIAKAMTTPLDRLVNGVRALATGDYSYSMKARGSVEVTALADDFMVMRQQLMDMQRRQLDSERLAALGRAAGSISHDLRHQLAAVVANAEFLHDADQLGFDRDEIYKEIERASAQMTALIDSLLEVSRERLTLSVGAGDLKDVVTRAAEAVRCNPEFRNRNIEIRTDVPTNGTFDSPKLQRAFFNLLQNACEATALEARVGVTITGNESSLEALVWDTGSGIPESIRDNLFEPFVSAGKNNGTGLGLAITAKIVHDHGGQIRIDQTSTNGTTFRVCIPRRCATVPSPSTTAVA